MGVSRCYCHNRLCCDECGSCDGTVRRVRCPWNYCPRFSLCASCRTRSGKFFLRVGRLPQSKEEHRAHGCEEGHRRFEAERQHERDLVAAGFYLRHSAMNTDATDPATGERIVQVVFGAAPWGTVGPERWTLMRATTYEAEGVGRVATVEDFARIGPVRRRPRRLPGTRDPVAGGRPARLGRGPAAETAPAPGESSKGVVLA